jgi:hypothetical protein
MLKYVLTILTVLGLCGVISAQSTSTPFNLGGSTSYISPGAGGGGGGSSLTSVNITGNTTLTANARHVVNAGSGTVTLTLPATAAFGDVVIVDGAAGANWRIVQNSGQLIYYNETSSSYGTGNGIASSDPINSVSLVCSVVNSNFVAEALVGTIANYTLPAPTEGHFLMNDNAASTVIHNTLTSNGTISGGNTEDLTTTGKINAGISFDNGGVDISGSIGDLDWSHDISFSFWINQDNGDSDGDDGTPIQIGADGHGVLVYNNANGGTIGACINGGAEGDTVVYFQPNSTLFSFPMSRGAWHLLVVTWEASTGTMTAYVDNVLAHAEVVGTSSDVSTSVPFHFGAQNGGGSFFHGTLDDIRIKSELWDSTKMDFIWNSGNGTEAELP